MTYEEYNIIMDARELCGMHHDELSRASARGMSVMIAYKAAHEAELQSIMDELDEKEAEVFMNAYHDADGQPCLD